MTVPAAWFTGDAELQFEQLDFADVRLEQATLTIRSAEPGIYHLHIASDVFQFRQHRLSNLLLTCEARYQADSIQCRDGDLRAAHADLGTISGRAAFDYHHVVGLQSLQLQNLQLAGGRSNIEYRNADRPHLTVQLVDAEAGQLPKLLAAVTGLELPETLASMQGQVSLTANIRDPATRPVAEIDLAVNQLHYDGESVFQGIDLRGTLSAMQDGDTWQLTTKLQVDRGEMYVVAPVATGRMPPGFYIEVPDAGLALTSRLQLAGNGHSEYIIEQLHYEHPGVLQLDLDGRVSRDTEFRLAELRVRVSPAELEQAFPIYLQPWLIDTGFNDLTVQGLAGVDVSLADGKVQSLEVMLDDLDIIDNGGRFAVRGLTTDLALALDQQQVSQLQWRTMDLYRLPFGDGEIRVASDGMDMQVIEWQDVPLLDGRLSLEQLDISVFGEQGPGVHLAGTLAPLSLLILTDALGWPSFAGSLGGQFSGVSYQNGDLQVSGELRIDMFDGQVLIRGLRVRDLFGVLPALEAQIRVTDLDLERLTETFAFGRITGRINGQVDDLLLENWQPVAFDAEFSTRGDRRERHRISQKALNNITQIGGGLQGALSRGFLRYFDEYSYGDLGLSCRLINGYCVLGGVERSGDDHYILTRGGLLPPWVEVRLTGSVIAWDVLMESIRQMAAGEIYIE